MPGKRPDPVQVVKQRRDAALARLVGRVPYVGHLGVSFERHGDELTAVLQYGARLIGNPALPALHGGAIEMGAGWVPAMIRRLDHAVEIWKRSEPRLGTFERRPSEQAAAQLRFTPYPFEDIGWLCVR